jgi:histidine triad (HIT) family protein
MIGNRRIAIGLIHNPKLRNFLLKIFGQKNFFWKLITPLLKAQKAMKGECIFCKIVRGEISSKKVYENEKIVAFHDINPQAPIHILVVPKKHIEKITDISDSEEDKEILYEIIKVCKIIADQMKIAERGFRIVVNTNPEGGQTVYHLHFHLLGGRQMRWPPG